jgi:predicted O-methyltransferase YrrM
MDLPSVVRIASRYIREAGLEARVELRPGDFTVDPLGGGFDLVLMSYVTHLIGPAANSRLLARAFDATVPGGRLVIHDYVLEGNRTRPTAAALYSLNMLVSSHSGAVHSFDEYRTWLEGAGFTDVRKVRLLGPTDVVMAKRPPAG